MNPSSCSGASAERRQSSTAFSAALFRDAATPSFLVPMRDFGIVETLHGESTRPARSGR